MKKSNPQKIIWAIDPFEEKSAIRPHVVATLKELSKPGTTIEPVYVLCPTDYELKPSLTRSWLSQIQPITQKALNRIVESIGLPGLLKPRLLIESRPSTTQATLALVRYAKRSGATLIAVGTHSKKGLSRLLLGSFAETLLLRAPVPVLIVGPHSEVFKINHILFSTNLGKTSGSTFKHVLALAKQQSARITLFYAIPHPAEVVYDSALYILGGTAVPFPDYVTADTESKRRIADRYAALAKKNGINLKVHFESNYGNVSQAVLRQAASEKANIIAMAAESGSLSTTLIGSIARQIVRGAHCPVWIMRASK